MPIKIDLDFLSSFHLHPRILHQEEILCGMISFINSTLQHLILAYLASFRSFDCGMRELYDLFECMVEVPRIRIETLINEEALLLAKFLRKERKMWRPRVSVLA